MFISWGKNIIWEKMINWGKHVIWNNEDLKWKEDIGNSNTIIYRELTAKKNKNNSISLGNGEKNLLIEKDIEAKKGGVNEITMGQGQHTLIIGNDVAADNNGANRIHLGNGDSLVNIHGKLESRGLNEILLDSGSHKVVLGGMEADKGGINRLVTEGETSIIVTGKLDSENRNEIITGKGNDEILILDGLKAERGVNRISSGDGDDRIIIGDNIEASGCGINIIETGTGNDYIELYDKVGRGALRIDAGEGYDTLVLHSRSAIDFNCDYRSWLTGLASQGDLASSNLEAIQIDINSRFKLNQIDWLTQLINRHNNTNSDAKIDLTLNLDDNGSIIRLDDIFTRPDESAITGINLSGDHKNMLYIRGSLAMNGYDGGRLKITGDSNDAVVLDQNWQRSDSDFVDELGMLYNIYSNNAADEVLIQAGMSVGIV